jgi:hypothetical protein
MEPILYAAATKLEPNGADIAACETDFIFVAPTRGGGKVQLAIGECKTRRPIEERDVDNLLRVARSFPPEQFDIFLVFAKLADFTEYELQAILRVNEGDDHRAILFTERELEPWFVYERTEKIFDIEKVVISLQDLADVTHTVFYEKRVKTKPASAEGADQNA